MSSSCAQWRGDIGAYIVGALDARARCQVTRHLTDCAGCRADYDELVPVRNWLSLLDLTTCAPQPGAAGQPGPSTHHPPQEGPVAAADALLQPSWPQAGTRIPAQPAEPAPARRPRAWRWAQAGAAALAAAAVAVAVLVSSGATPPTYRAADGATGVSARAQLHDTPAGTQIDLTATGLPAQQRCILVAVGHDGTDIAGSWDATYGGSARIIATTAFPASQLTALRIETDTGTLLVSIRL
jgi:Putative zinc-finger